MSVVLSVLALRVLPMLYFGVFFFSNAAYAILEGLPHSDFKAVHSNKEPEQHSLLDIRKI